MTIAIDFDGTCVTHDFPKVGKDIGAVPVLKRLTEAGHELILFTMRSAKAGISPVTGEQEEGGLEDAIKWFQDHDIPLYGIQRNPTQDSWTTSPKCYAQLYIDDAALGCPLINNPRIHKRPFVDWQEVECELLSRDILTY
jgi:hypothetical protein